MDVAAGGSGPIVWMHAGSVVLIGVGIAAALVFGDRRALLRSMRRLFGVHTTGATPGGCGIGCGIRPIAARNLPGHRAWLDDLDG